MHRRKYKLMALGGKRNGESRERSFPLRTASPSFSSLVLSGLDISLFKCHVYYFTFALPLILAWSEAMGGGRVMERFTATGTTMRCSWDKALPPSPSFQRRT
mgnify:CR=1 FL=1